jgi:hypothetical protein
MPSIQNSYSLIQMGEELASGRGAVTTVPRRIYGHGDAGQIEKNIFDSTSGPHMEQIFRAS